MKKHLLKTILLLFALIAGSGTMRGAEEVYKTALFGSSYNSKGVSGYTGVSFNATNSDFTVNVANFNNNNNGWNVIKCGGKNGAYTGTITTDAAIDKAITKVALTIDAITSSKVTSIKLYTSSNKSSWTEAGIFDKSTGAKVVALDSPTANLYYKIEIVCARGSSNGLVTISRIDYYYEASTPCALPTFYPEAGTYTSTQFVTISTETEDATIYYTTDGTTPSSSNGTAYSSAITVSSTQTIKAIAVKDGNSDSEVATAAYTITSAVATTTTIDDSGITNTDVYVGTTAGSFAATVKDNEETTIAAAAVTWSSSNTDVATIDPSSGAVTLVAAGSTTITASYAGVTDIYQPSSDTYELTVTSSAPYVQPTSVTFNMNYEWLGSSNGSNLTSGDLPVEQSQDNVTVTITDGTSTCPRGDSNYIRVYKGSTITFAAPSGYDITGITFTTGGTGTWNAPTVNSGTLSNKTWSGSASSVVFTLGGTCFISSAEVTLAKQKELSSIALSGTYPTVFEVGDAFLHEGAVVTATYDDASEAVVTASAAFSIPDMSSAGVKTVTVSYTENAVEKTTKYDITVKAPAALESIALSGEYPTTFNAGDAFSHEGMTVTANFDDETNADVTASATFTGYDMRAAGVQTVTVSYTHKGETTKTTTYDITVNTVAVSSVTVAPTSATVKIGKTVTLTPTISPANATNKNVTWESNNTSVATVDGGVVTGVAAGEATITVKSAADPTKSASCTITVITAGDGSKANPFDVAEAIEYIDGSVDLTGKYVKGIIAKIDRCTADGNAQYWISDDGVTEDQFEVYNGYSYGGANFATSEDIKVGDNVIIYGDLTYYSKHSVYEFAKDNYIYSLNGVKIPEITFGQESYNVLYNGSLTITATADGNGAITYSSSDATIAEINETTGVVTPHKTGEVTITATIAASDNNIAGSKDVTLAVTDGRLSADIEFAEATITKTWGESFTGQELNNPNSVAVTYESSEPTVATVNASGVVTIVKAGTTTITASFAGDGDYMPAEVSYTLTVNKAAAGLSFDETAFDVDLNDDSFVAPTLNNPNSLTVTYASNDEDIAVVDENTGELLLVTTAEGSVTITASFAGNDNYNAGNASYTITITDPNKKGSKKNPYTVAEVNSGSYSGNNYVKGYIVGFFAGKDSDAASSGNSNIALSDSPSEISGANTIAVQLPSGDIRTAWNIDDNDVIGYEVIVYGNITGYFTGKTGVKSTSEFSAVSVPVTVGAAGYTTITTEYAVSFEGTDVTAYKAAAVISTSISLEEVEEAPAGTPLVIKATEGKHTGITIIPSADDIVGNLLHSSNGSVEGDGSTIYALGKKSGVVGFYKVADGVKVPSGKAYLEIAVPGVREFLNFSFDEETGINSIVNGKLTIDNCYDLSGRRVVKPTKGLYIVNGKKYIKK